MYFYLYLFVIEMTCVNLNEQITAYSEQGDAFAPGYEWSQFFSVAHVVWPISI